METGMNNELDMLLVFFVVTVTALFARHTVQVEFRPKFHLALLFIIVFSVAILDSSISYQFPLIETIWRSGGVAATSIFGFYFFRYLVRKYDPKS